MSHYTMLHKYIFFERFQFYFSFIPLALVGYEMIIAKSSLRASLATYHLISKKRSCHEFIIYAMRPRARADNLTICYREKQINVIFSCVCLVIDNEFRHNIVKVVCGWRNSWSTTEQTIGGSRPWAKVGWRAVLFCFAGFFSFCDFFFFYQK